MSTGPSLVNFGVFEAPFSEIRERVVFHLGRGDIAFDMCERQNDWQRFYAERGKLFDIMRVCCFLYALSPERTVYVCNLADGWHSLFWNIAREGRDAVWFRSTLSADVVYGVHDMEIWRSGAVVRHIRTLQEERGWEFLSEGDPQPFERIADLAKRRVQARFNIEHIRLYCRKLGFDFDDAYAHAGRGVVIARI